MSNDGNRHKNTNFYAITPIAHGSGREKSEFVLNKFGRLPSLNKIVQ